MPKYPEISRMKFNPCIVCDSPYSIGYVRDNPLNQVCLKCCYYCISFFYHNDIPLTRDHPFLTMFYPHQSVRWNKSVHFDYLPFKEFIEVQLE